MAKQDLLLDDWTPEFAGGEWEPGDYEMPSPTGDGVAARKPKQNKVGARETGITNLGKEWPRDHNDTPAMCDVDEDGVEHEPQGSHESTHAEANDGIQDKVGHNWPDQPKNSGQGVAEPFEGTRWSDGGVLKGQAPDEFDISDGGAELPSDGPITGTSGPQLGQLEENWSPHKLATYMEEDVDLQALFNSYARSASAVCVEDFQQLCDAYGTGVRLDESSLLSLMNANNEFMFHEGSDSNGAYWVPGAITESDDGCSKCHCKPCKCKAGKGKCGMGKGVSGVGTDAVAANQQMGLPQSKQPGQQPGMGMGKKGHGKCHPNKTKRESTDRNGRTLNEWQFRTPEQEAGLYNHDQGPAGYPSEEEETDLYGGDPHGGAMTGNLGVSDAYDERLGGAGGVPLDDPTENMEPIDPRGEVGLNDVDEDDDYGIHDSPSRVGGFYSGGEFGEPQGMVRPHEMGVKGPSMEPEFDEFGMGSGMGPEMGHEDAHGEEEFGGEHEGADDLHLENRATVIGPKIVESLSKFMKSAKSIISNNQDVNRRDVAEALNRSWAYYAHGIDPRTVPANVQTTLGNLQNQFPGFFCESGGDAMKAPEGTKIGSGGATNHSSFLPDQPGPDEMKQHGSKDNPLQHTHKNSLEGTPIIKGTEKGMSGKGGDAAVVKENVKLLSKHVKESLRESARALTNKGKYNISFSVVVTEGKKKNKTKQRSQLAEALADVEEILQFHRPDDVTLEASFHDTNGVITLKQDVPLFTINQRGPMVSEGKALFRFKRNAEQFANELVAEGAVCRIAEHTWGNSVAAKVPYATAMKAFSILTEKKWMQAGINKDHAGYCTPMTKSTCTPARKALAKRFKKGGDLHHAGKND